MDIGKWFTKSDNGIPEYVDEHLVQAEWPSVTDECTKEQLLLIAKKKLALARESYSNAYAQYVSRIEKWREKAKDKVLNWIESDDRYSFSTLSSIENELLGTKPYKPDNYSERDLQFRISALEQLPDGPVHYLLREVLGMSYDTSREGFAGYKNPNG